MVDHQNDKIATILWMEWSMAQFVDGGGEISFIYRLCQSLRTDEEQVTVLEVREDGNGRIEIIYEIEMLEGRSIEFFELMQRRAFESGTVQLGAPVVEFESAIANDGSDSFEHFYHLYFDQDDEGTQLVTESNSESQDEEET